jgi:peptidoglycan/LPS O-acetylase OafA/YrhL
LWILHVAYSDDSVQKYILLDVHPQSYSLSLLSALIWHTGVYVVFYQAIYPLYLLFFILTNIVIFGQDIVTFLPSINHAPASNYLLLHQAWSLSLELVFYLLVPFLVRRSTWILVMIMAASLLLRAYLVSKGLSEDPWSYRFFPIELVFFVLGIISHRHIPNGGLIPWIACIAGVCFFPNILLLPLVALCLPSAFMVTRNWRLDRLLGDLSYPLYLSHLLFLEWNQTWHLPLSLLFLLVIAVSVLLVLYVDRPIARWKHTH